MFLMLYKTNNECLSNVLWYVYIYFHSVKLKDEIFYSIWLRLVE